MLALVVVLSAAGAASALSQDCAYIGDSIACDNGVGGQLLGGTTYFSDGTTAREYGGATYFDDGRVTRHDGRGGLRLGARTGIDTRSLCARIAPSRYCD
jgi:hypothetical protein